MSVHGPTRALIPGLIALLFRRPDIRHVGIAAYVEEATLWSI